MRNLLINTLFLFFLMSFVNCQGSRQLIRDSGNVEEKRVIKVDAEKNKRFRKIKRKIIKN